MRKKFGDGIEAFDSATRAARKINDDSCASNPGDPTRQNCTRSFLGPFQAHMLAETWDEPFGNGNSGFRGKVARSYTCSTGCEDQIRVARVRNIFQEGLNCRMIVR